MYTKKTLLAASILAALGTSAYAISAAAGQIIADGDYQMLINTTPYVTSGTYTFPNFGSDGAWNSGFTFGCVPQIKGCASVSMTDNNAVVNGRGGGVLDGYAGKISIHVSGGNITVSSFQVDPTPGTPAGTFAQYTDASTIPVNMIGGVDASGNMTFTPTGRLGTGSSFPALVDERWNVDNFNGTTGSGTSFVVNPPTGNTAWSPFSTAAATNDLGTIHGAAITATGGGNYHGVLVSASRFGSDWGGFYGANYFEAWNVDFTPVPLPATVWLFGSGLAAILGVARRKRKTG